MVDYIIVVLVVCLLSIYVIFSDINVFVVIRVWIMVVFV